MVSPSLCTTVAGWLGVHIAASRAQLVLTTFGHDDQERERVRGLGGEQRLSSLAQPGLIGEQEGAVTVLRGRDHARLVGHQLEPGRDVRAGRRWQVHAGRASPAGLLEGTQQRLDQRPVGEQANRCSMPPARRSGRGRGTGWRAAGRRRTGAPPAASGGPESASRRDHGGRGRLRLGHARLGVQLAHHVVGARLERDAVPEQAQEGCVARSRTRHRLREAVEALQLSGALALVGLGLGLGAELAGHEGHGLERRQGGRGDLALVDRSRHPPHGVGQGGDPAVALVTARRGGSPRAWLLRGGLLARRTGAASAATARSRWHSHSPWVDCTCR